MNLLAFRDLFPRLKIPAASLQRVHTEFDPHVLAFQERWNKVCPNFIVMPANGIYDENCRARVQAWQLGALAIMGDGFVGPQTARALNIKLLGDDNDYLFFS